MAGTSNIAIQTFLELQQVKGMLTFAKITFWETNTLYEIGKPVLYNNKLYICHTNHTSGETLDTEKFYTIEASSVNPSNVPINDPSFTGTNLGAVLSEIFVAIQNVDPSKIPVNNNNFVSKVRIIFSLPL
jgi:hypothetical protein